MEREKMGRIPFSHLNFRVHVHATEDEDKVLTAIRNVLGEVRTDRRLLSGFHGNPIVVLTGRLSNRRRILSFLARLGKEANERIASELDQRMDEDNSLRLRLDKQEALFGLLQLSPRGDAIDIAVKIESFPASRDRAISSAAGYLANLCVDDQDS